MVIESGTSEGRADYKVPGGKLIRVRVRHRDGIIESIMFNGISSYTRKRRSKNWNRA